MHRPVGAEAGLQRPGMTVSLVKTGSPVGALTEQSIPSRLRLLESRGCPAVYLWSAGDSSDATHWTAIEQRQVREYLAVVDTIG